MILSHDRFKKEAYHWYDIYIIPNSSTPSVGCTFGTYYSKSTPRHRVLDKGVYPLDLIVATSKVAAYWLGRFFVRKKAFNTSSGLSLLF